MVVGVILSSSALADCGVLPKTGSFLSYAIKPNVNNEVVSLEVTLKLRLDGKSVDLILPSEWAGAEGTL